MELGLFMNLWNVPSDAELKEPQIPFSPLFTIEKCGLRNENIYFGDVFHKNSIR
jgi:hypothetical protein